MKTLSNIHKFNNDDQYKTANNRMLVIAIGFISIVIIGSIFLFSGFDSLPLEIERPYLIPWVIATGLVIILPSVFLFYKKGFDLAHPLTFACLTYFFPIFFLGGLSLTFGFSRYYYLNYVADPQYNFPLTFVYIMLGFGGLSIGFFIPQAKRIGNYLTKWLPVWEFKPDEIVIPSLLFLGFGLFSSLIAFEFGQIGYQRAGIIFDVTGSFYNYLTLIIPSTTILLWLAFFKIPKWNLNHLIIVILQILIAVFMLVLLGGRSSLLFSLILMLLAYSATKGKFKTKYLIIIGIVLPVILIFGMVYGTTFRTLKTNDERVSVEEYVGLAVDTFEHINEENWSRQIGETTTLLAERLEIVSSLAVVVSNYEDLQSYEAGYGLENNIWTYTWTAFIPRLFWKDKPIIADNYSYNELYFDHGGFGLAITAMGDLLRNFGPVGVPLGMILLGFALRIMYSMLIESSAFSIWKSTLFLTILTKISYDSFYGDIFPTVIRVAVVVFIQLFILKIIIYALRRSK